MFDPYIKALLGNIPKDVNPLWKPGFLFGIDLAHYMLACTADSKDRSADSLHAELDNLVRELKHLE